jgi:F420-dependent oxidoreductase-like protein
MGAACYVSVGKSVEAAIGRVKLAEELGYDTVYATHINGAESLTMLTAYAALTARMKVGPGVVPIYTRTPATMAQTAATMAALSGGRLVLGIGVSHRPLVEGWHGQTIDKPVAEMREYVGHLRAILRGEQFEGASKWQTGFVLQPQLLAPELPIYVAALSPGMLRLAGEIADGVMLWLCNPNYIRDVVVPTVREGRERAGKPLEGFDIVAAVPAALTGDPAAARAAQQRDLGPYLHLPFYRAMLERSGFDPDAMQGATADEYLDLLCAIGDEDGVRAGLQRYRDAGATTAAVGPIAHTDFDATLRAGAP